MVGQTTIRRRNSEVKQIYYYSTITSKIFHDRKCPVYAETSWAIGPTKSACFLFAGSCFFGDFSCPYSQQKNLERHYGEVLNIGGHSDRYPWSSISDWAWYRNVRYRTEVRRVRHYIGYWNKLLSDIWYLTTIFVNPRSAVVIQRIFHMKTVDSNPVWHNYYYQNFPWVIWEWFINSRYRIIQYWFSPISEWKLMSISEWEDLIQHILFRYRNKRCWCRISTTWRPMSMPTYGAQRVRGSSP